MNVVHVAPLWFPVSRQSMGGIETLLAGLLGRLGRLGCTNTLVATGDAEADAHLVPVVARSLFGLMADGLASEYQYYEQQAVITALELAPGADLVHSHLGPAGYVLSAVPGVGARTLHTQHNDVTPDLAWFVAGRPEMWLSTVSHDQARRLGGDRLPRCRVIPNGVDVAAFPFEPKGGNGLVFLGRMEADKGADIAIDVAETLGLPLLLAGPVVDPGFFAARIAPRLNRRVQYVGVVSHTEKCELLGSAACALVPSRFQEAFGLVAVEAMACGTPVAALANGGLPEVVDDGVTGFTVHDEGALPRAAAAALELDRTGVRGRAEQRFSLDAVAAAYRRLYDEIAGGPGP